MEGHLNLRRKDREALRERWFQRAAKAFERMFGEANQDQLVTLTEREDMACLLGEELKAFLLEEHIGVDRQARPSEKHPPGCPKCHEPGQRASKPEEKLEQRELTTRAGEIKLQREKWRCPKCRIIFFSVRPQVETGDGALQSAAAGKGGAAGKSGRVVQGSQ